jgi:hypothetical protein
MTVPLEKEYHLVKTDKAFDVPEGEPTRVTIQQATQRAHERRAALFAQIIRETTRGDTEDVVRFIQRYSFEELKRIECYLTMVSCNILDVNGNLLFKYNSNGKISEDAFKVAWDTLIPSVAQEIHDCVLDLNIDWRPLGEET